VGKVARETARRVRHERVRRKISGTAERPRLVVKRSLHHIYAALVDDLAGNTLVSASTLEKSLANSSRTNVDAAKAVGKAIAEKAKAVGVSRAVFDRSGYRYHGRVQALADAAREGGLEF
jgi:large subunit ribosomal protein L18